MVGSVGRRMPGLHRVNRAYKIVETLKFTQRFGYDNTSNS